MVVKDTRMGKNRQVKGRVLIIDNYARHGTSAIRDIEKTAKDAGYETEVIRHTDARKGLKERDILEGFDAYIASGSGRAWKRSGTKDAAGREYVEQGSDLDKFLAEHEKQGYHICG